METDAALEENQVRGELAKVACPTIMTVMFCARLARHDLLRACAALATFLHKWTALTDKKLVRLMSYIRLHADDRQIGFIGDPLDALWLALFADADFAGDRDKQKSTGGVFLVLMGPNTFFPLTAASKKQRSEAAFYRELEHGSRNCVVGTRAEIDWDSSTRPVGRVATTQSCPGCLRGQSGDGHHRSNRKV